MIFDDVNLEDVEFGRNTISSWTNKEEKKLKELHGDELEKFRRELVIRQMHIYDSLIVFEEDGKLGLKSKGFDYVVVQPIYDSIRTCWSNYFVVENDGKFGILCTGYFDYEILFPIVCDSITSSGVDLLIIKVNDKLGLLKMVDRSIKVIAEPIYDAITKEGEEDLYIIKKEGKLGLYHHGIVINPLYDDVYVPQVFGWIKVKKNGEWGYISINKEFTTDVDEAFLYYPFMLIAEEYV